MKVALDTNILVYAEGAGDPRRCGAATALVEATLGDVVIPDQVLGELFNVMVRKAGWSKREAAERISAWRRLATPYEAEPDGILRAAQLAADHGLQIWDAVIVTTAASAGCSILVSEDMQHDFFWNGLTIVNPFRSPSHPLLEVALRQRS